MRHQIIDVFTPPSNIIRDPAFFDVLPSPNGMILNTKIWWPVENGLTGGQYLVDLATLITTSVVPHNEGPSSWSPNSQQLVFMGADWKLQVWEMHTQQVTELDPTANLKFLPIWSPNGEWIAYACASEAVDLSLPATKVSLCLIHPDGSGKRVLLEQILLWSNDPTYPKWNFDGDVARWSPDSQKIAYLTGDSQPDIAIVDIQTGESQIVVSNPARDVSPDWSPDGLHLAFASNRNDKAEIFVLDLVSGELAGPFAPVNGDAFAPVWSPAGDHIAFFSRSRSSGFADNNISVMRPNGSNVVRVGQKLATIMRVFWLSFFKPK